jgi:hypothetical protein
MEFSEAGQAWRALPDWARALINFGYQWPADDVSTRRIALISMPCDSAGAGLIALGAMIRGMASPKANDADGHYDALKRHTLQYLKSCRLCQMRCDPPSRGCGYTAEAKGLVRHRDGVQWTISEDTNLNQGHIKFVRERKRAGRILKEWHWLNPSHPTDWVIEGEPAPHVTNPAVTLPQNVFGAIVNGASIVPDNLRKSFSGLCLAGRVTGKTATRDLYSSLRFRIGGVEYGLPELLTVYGWHQFSQLSRITFFNAHTQLFDRNGYAPAVVVADGDTSFLRVLDRSEFQRSDVIGVIHRAVERDSLEAVGNRMLGLHQWYVEDAQLMSRLPAMPKGISGAVLRRGTP